MTAQELTALTQHIDATQTECDGASRLIHLSLLRAGIIHQVFVGTIKVEGIARLPIHYWVNVGGKIIDYRARMWLGDDAPHGVFKQIDHLAYAYVGKPTSFRLDGCLYLEKVKGVIA